MQLRHVGEYPETLSFERLGHLIIYLVQNLVEELNCEFKLARIGKGEVRKCKKIGDIFMLKGERIRLSYLWFNMSIFELRLQITSDAH